MNREKLKTAIEEAERFLKKAKEYPEQTYYEHHGHQFPNTFPKENGAIKRASMDLSRALADLRKPDL